MKPRADIGTLLGIVLLLVSASVAGAQGEDVYSERTLELSRKLACPVCEGQSVADSQSRLAREMKQTIESQVQAGKSDEEILDFFVARFGEEVLLEPPRSGLNLTLWWIPVAALLLGGVVVALYLRDNMRTGAQNGGSPTTPRSGDLEDPELEEIAHDVLDELPRDRSRHLERGAE